MIVDPVPLLLRSTHSVNRLQRGTGSDSGGVLREGGLLNVSENGYSQGILGQSYMGCRFWGDFCIE